MLRPLSKKIIYSFQNGIFAQKNVEKSLLLFALHPSHEQIRTTYVFRRKYPIQLMRYDDTLDTARRMKPYDYVYEVLEPAEKAKLEPLKVLLIKPVPGIGSPGQVVEMNRRDARLSVLLPGLGVYASPENIEKFSYLADSKDDRPSTPFALKTALQMEMRCFNVSMNMENPWTIEPWHIRVAFRRAGVHVPEYAITLPEKPISGPDLSIEEKEFLVKVKINNKEEALIRMRVHHVSTDILDRLPKTQKARFKLSEPIFPEEADILKKLNDKDPTMIEREE